MTFKLKSTDKANPTPRTVDDETGVELFQKYFREGQDALMHDIGLFRHNIVVYRDPTYRSSQGISDIEFYARSLIKEPEEKPYTGSRRFPKSGAVAPLGSRILGFEIDSEEFDDAFREYAGRDQNRLLQIRTHVTDALLSFFAFPRDKVVQFREGVNRPRKRYGLHSGIVRDLDAIARFKAAVMGHQVSRTSKAWHRDAIPPLPHGKINAMTRRHWNQETVDQIPSLPQLVIQGRTRPLATQEIVDRWVKTIYERRPDIFVSFGMLDRAIKGASSDEEREACAQRVKAVKDDLTQFLREELGIQGPPRLLTQVRWETRKRARHMYRSPISSPIMPRRPILLGFAARFLLALGLAVVALWTMLHLTRSPYEHLGLEAGAIYLLLLIGFTRLCHRIRFGGDRSPRTTRTDPPIQGRRLCSHRAAGTPGP
jgi:hypothetical protein